jgi:hypothetical protein
MGERSETLSRWRRARWTLWGLVAFAVMAMGSLSVGLGAPPGPLTGLRVAVSGLVLVVSLALALRVMMALDRARQRSAQTPPD